MENLILHLKLAGQVQESEDFNLASKIILWFDTNRSPIWHITSNDTIKMPKGTVTLVEQDTHSTRVLLYSV